MGAVAKQPRRPRGSGSIQWKHGRPYAVFRDLITGKPKWEGFDSEEEADAFLTQWAADKKAAKLAAKAAQAEREARAPRSRPSSSSRSWTFGEVLTDWEDRHRDSVQDSTMRDYGPGLNDLREALGGVLARSLTDEHFEAYKRAKLDGIDVRGGEASVRKLAASTVNKRLDLARRVIDDAVRRGSMTAPNPVREVVRPRAPKREQMVLTEAEMRKLIEAAGTLELRALIRCFCELALRFSEATGLPIAAYDPSQRTVRIRQQAAERRDPKPTHDHQGLRKIAMGHPHSARVRGTCSGARCDHRDPAGQAERAWTAVHRHTRRDPQRAELPARQMATDASTRRLRREGRQGEDACAQRTHAACAPPQSRLAHCLTALGVVRAQTPALPRASLGDVHA